MAFGFCRFRQLEVTFLESPGLTPIPPPKGHFPACHTLSLPRCPLPVLFVIFETKRADHNWEEALEKRRCSLPVITWTTWLIHPEPIVSLPQYTFHRQVLFSLLAAAVASSLNTRALYISMGP